VRESEEKQRRAREAREKAEAERAARAERKRALVDMNAHETQEGVMDSLMEALQTGSAFSRPDQRRKRQTRAAGGKSKLTLRSKSYATLTSRLKLANKTWKLKRSLKQANAAGGFDRQEEEEEEKCQGLDGFRDSSDWIINGRKEPKDKKLFEPIVDARIKRVVFKGEKATSGGKGKSAFRKIRRLSRSLYKNVYATRQGMIVGKRPKRNAFIRQIVFRRRERIVNKAKAYRFDKSANGCSSANATLPNNSLDWRDLITGHYSKSCDNLSAGLGSGTLTLMLSGYDKRERHTTCNEPDENENVLNVSLERSYDKHDEIFDIDDSIIAASGRTFLSAKSRTFKRFFTFREPKLFSEMSQSNLSRDDKVGSIRNVVNTFSPQAENYRKPINWKIWKGTKNTGKITISVDDRSKK
jgi:hypothetical protein